MKENRDYADPALATEKRLGYNKGCLCTKCKIWFKQLMRTPVNIALAVIDEFGKSPIRYYDIEGKQRKVLFVWPIKELINPLKCPFCKKKLRGKSHDPHYRKRSKEKTSSDLYPEFYQVGRPKGRKNNKIKTKEEIEKANYNEMQFFEQLQRKANLNREAIIDTPDENLTLIERTMKHDPSYWRILSRKIKEQITEDSKQKNLIPTRKETQIGSRFMFNSYAGDKDSKYDKYDIKSFREELFREWQEHIRKFQRNTDKNETKTSHVT